MSRSFHFPVPSEAWAEFCHPDAQEDFGQPFRWENDWGVANGYLALRVESFVDCTRDCPAAVERIERLPWAWPAERDATHIRDAEWVALEDRAAGLRKWGETRYWQRTSDDRYCRRTLKRVQIGPNRVQVCLAEMQLLARLPKVELMLDSPPAWLHFRFKGGRGMVKGFTERERRECSYWLWKGSNNDLFNRI